MCGLYISVDVSINVPVHFSVYSRTSLCTLSNGEGIYINCLNQERLCAFAISKCLKYCPASDSSVCICIDVSFNCIAFTSLLKFLDLFLPWPSNVSSVRVPKLKHNHTMATAHIQTFEPRAECCLAAFSGCSVGSLDDLGLLQRYVWRRIPASYTGVCWSRMHRQQRTMAGLQPQWLPRFVTLDLLHVVNYIQLRVARMCGGWFGTPIV